MRFLRLILLFAGILAGSSIAGASTLYTYTGQPFTYFSNTTGMPPELLEPYTGNDHVSLQFELSQPGGDWHAGIIVSAVACTSPARAASTSILEGEPAGAPSVSSSNPNDTLWRIVRRRVDFAADRIVLRR